MSTYASAQSTSVPSCKVLDPELQGMYSGGCVDGLAEGRGEAQGVARYEGEFRAGRKHGAGIKTWPTGDRYEGGFVEDRREGRGSYTWGSGTPWAGERYVGHYRNDQRDGEGAYSWPDGERYVGVWKDDVVVGPYTARALARLQEERERFAAVSKPGLSVCRQMRVGSVVLDWVRGTVLSVEGLKAKVRIDDPGQFEHRIQGVAVKKSVQLEDWALMWTPCLPPAKK